MPARRSRISCRPNGWPIPDVALSENHRGAELLPGIPDRIVKVFPPAATPLPDRIEPINDLDAIDVLRVLVANLHFHAKAERRTVADRQLLAIHSVSEDGLRVERVLQVYALVVVLAVKIDLVQAMEYGVARIRSKPRESEETRQLDSRPLPDRTPTFVAVMHGDLGTRGERLQLGERQRERPIDQAMDAQLPVAKFTIEQPLVVIALRHRRAVHRERRGEL